MIKIVEATPKKIPGLTSLFITSPYNEQLLDIIKKCQSTHFDKKTKEWEVSIINLSFLLDSLTEIDDIDLNLIQHPDIGAENKIKYNQLSDSEIKLFKHQEEAVEFGLNHNKWLLLDVAGLGKATTLDTPILTPIGFKPMRDINIDDELYDENGDICKCTNIFNHENLEMYKITFSDGSFVECCKDHLWQFNYYKTNYRGKELSNNKILTTTVKSTEWLYTHNYKRMQVHIPICKPINFPEKDLPIHPYLLGCLLGDGYMCKNQLNFTTADDFILNRLIHLLPKDCEIRKKSPHGKAFNYSIVASKNSKHYHKRNKNLLINILRDLGLADCKSRDKFIPDIYKYSSIEDRIQLIQGLLDTDGYAASSSKGRNGKYYNGVLQFTTISPKLFEDFVEIIESLGGLVSKNIRDAICYNGRNNQKINCGLKYTGTIQIEDPTILVSLPRKKERLNPRKINPRRLIKNIEKIPNAPGKCITVDSPSHLYVIKNYIVTHNTLSLIKLAEELKERENIEHCLIICGLNSLKRNWKSEIKKFSKLDSIIIGEYISKSGKVYAKSIKDRIEQLKNPINEFFVIINIESLRDEKIIDAIMHGKNKFQMIGFDEMHCCKNSQSSQGSNTLKLSSKYQLGMTGTLILNNPLDTYFALKWIGVEHSSLTNFKYHYCVYGGDFGHDIVGYKNTDQLKEQIEKYSLRRTKDIIKDLPPKNIINEFLEMDDKQSKFYENIKQGILKERKEGVRLMTQNLLAMTTRFRQATECPQILTNEDIPSAKIERCISLCDQILSDPNEKIVIFSYFKETCNQLMEKLAHYNPVLCTGDVPDDIVDQRKNMFNNDTEHRILIGTIQKMSTGHTLNRASYLIMLNEAWTKGGNDQAHDRIHRVNNTNPAFIYNLITLDTFDEYVHELVEMKGAISDYLIDDEQSPELMNKLRKYIEDLK